MEPTLSPTMQEATDVFISNLLASEALVRYQQAQVTMNTDSQANALLNQLSEMQSELRQKQANKSLTKDEIDALRSLQEKARENTAIKEYADSQQEVINLVREINTEINQLLGIDFASLTRRSGCC
jgi:cell fate (sporulation/competence/biofilm development) regulator YlbF (YheA/YmcA/DUF963 family)